jgi:integrase
MALLWECPKCKKRNSEKAKTCNGKKDGNQCGFLGNKFSGRVWWIEYYDHEKRLRRERIGPNKAAAEQRLREILSARTEGRYIKKSPDCGTLFKDLAPWYLNLSEVKAKKSFEKDKMHSVKLMTHFGDRLLIDITPAMVETYKQKRLSEPSGRSPNSLTKPATVNREIACLKTIFNKAIKNGKAERNPVQGVKLLKENNERDRILTLEEYARLMACCSPHLKSIIKVAYHTGMRQGEILNLTWGQVDLKDGFIKLNPENTKTNEGRLVPLTEELVEMFRSMPRGLPEVKVFTFQGKPLTYIKVGFVKACKRAGIEDFTFHDLRHTAINNWRMQGHDYFRIMAASGHKTMSVFKRYNTVSKDELRALVKG